jgi:uncharacterized membrane protein
VAGIGFRLKALLREDVTGGWIRAHVYGAVVSSGPWLLSVLTLATLSALARSVVADAAQDLFRSMVAYTYTFTLITTGAVQMVVTRHLADELFTGRSGALRPIFRWSIGATAVVHAVLAGLFYGLAPELTWAMRVLGVGLTVVVACTWIAMIFVGALQDYASVGRAFLVGNVASLVAALGLGRLAGPAGYVAGFALGQAAIFFTLAARVEREFPGEAPDEERRLLRAFRRYPDLAVAGLLYNVAIAIDRIIFWASPAGWRVTSWFFGSVYDTPLYLAYISTVPALAIFLVRVETEFYDAYRTYYGAVIKQGTLRQILDAKATMARSLRESLRRLLQVQTPVVVLLLVLTPWIAGAIGLERGQFGIFRAAVVGATLHVFALFLTIMLLYFDRRRVGLEVSAVFLAANACLTLASLAAGPRLHGFGYALAALVTCCWAYWRLEQTFRDLEFITFSAQPLAPKPAAS